MTEDPKKPDATWLRQAQADGWHMTEVGLPERPDQRPWRKAIARRSVEVAVAGVMWPLVFVFIDRSWALPVLIGLCLAIGVVQVLIEFRHGFGS